MRLLIAVLLTACLPLTAHADDEAGEEATADPQPSEPEEEAEAPAESDADEDAPAPEEKVETDDGSDTDDADDTEADESAETPDAESAKADMESLLEKLKVERYDRPVVFRGIIGGRSVHTENDDLGAFILGLTIGAQSQLNGSDAAVPLGILGRARYLGAMGRGRGRSLHIGPRWWAKFGPLWMELGGDLVADRSKLNDGPTIPGAISAGADGRAYIYMGPIALMGGLQPEWFISGERLPRGDNGPLQGISDEISFKLGARILFVGLTWTRTTTAYGDIDTVIAGMEF